MAKTLTILNSRTMFLIMLVWLFIYASVHLWPASWWFEVNTLSAGPAQAYKPVPMTVDRKINRHFTGTWYVTVRQWGDRGWSSYCSATGSNAYQPEAVLPDRLTLEWWTDGRCSMLPAGRYTVETTWIVHGGPLPDKTIRAKSNIFEVTP